MFVPRGPREGVVLERSLCLAVEFCDGAKCVGDVG